MHSAVVAATALPAVLFAQRAGEQATCTCYADWPMLHGNQPVLRRMAHAVDLSGLLCVDILRGVGQDPWMPYLDI